MKKIVPKTDVEPQTWRRAVNGDANSFEEVVTCYQGAVSAVAFNIVGDFSTSQDIAQDTFWAAWSSRDSLVDPSKLRSWLCGIARNIARQWRRKKISRSEAGDSALDFAQTSSEKPVDLAISQEEEAIVWRSLEKLPENYREALVLFYRQDKSIDEVAKTLDLSNAATRQRLSRGREMLKSHVSQLVEGVLDRNNPRRSFTTRVMAGIVGVGVAGQSATASATTAATGPASAAAVAFANVIASGSISGMLFGLLGGTVGAAGGLLGAWMGTWLPAHFAPTETERQLLLERARPVWNGTCLFTAFILGITIAAAFGWLNWYIFFAALAVSMLTFLIAVVLFTLRTQSLIDKLRKEISPIEDPNRSPFGRRFNPTQEAKPSNQSRPGLRYTSSIKFLGIPLIDIQVSSPENASAGIHAKSDRSKPKWETAMPHQQACRARGWIAIGDIAEGMLIAIGGRAMGTIAIGGIAIGGVALGGISVAVIPLGGLAIGLISIGGVAIGYDTIGGLALGWHSAVGGAAVAYHIAVGGAAVAHDFAVGAAAVAAETNTELAHQLTNEQTLKATLTNPWPAVILATLVAAAVALIAPLLKLARNKDGQGNEK